LSFARTCNKSGADGEALAVVPDLGLGERIQIGDDFRPGAGAAERGDAVLQCLLQHQGEEAAEHVAADGLVELVEDRAGREQVLRGAEGLLHSPQLLVAEHGFERVEISNAVVTPSFSKYPPSTRRSEGRFGSSPGSAP